MGGRTLSGSSGPRRLSNTGNLESAREVAQDTFFRLCRQDPSPSDGQLSSWLFTVCRNRALDVLKKESRLQPVEDEEFWFAEVSGRDPAEQAVRQDDYDMVSTIVAGLSERDQDVLRLKFEHGMSYREIGEALQLSESNVGFILHQAIRKVRRCAVAAEENAVEPVNRLFK